MLNFKKEKLQEISFPLGGIGTGSVGLSGIGELIDWEINGRQNKGSVNEYTHFAVKAERDGKVIDARVLHGDITKNFTGTADAAHHHSWGYGHGPNRTTLAGMAHFGDVAFKGEFPIAEIEYSTEEMPADITLIAFNPFIPSDEDNSSLPSAFFEWKIKNTSCQKTDYTIAFSVGNPFKTTDGGFNRFECDHHKSSILLSSNNYKKTAPEYGELRVSTDCPDHSFQEYWYRSGWFDDLTTYWNEFSSFGKLKNRHYDDNNNPIGRLDVGDMCTVCAHVSLEANESENIKFLLSWYFPNFQKYWDSSKKKPLWKHYYCKSFSSSAKVEDYCYKNWNSLFDKTNKFKNALYSSTLPEKALEAAGANLAVLKSTTCLRLSNGAFWAWEGSNAHEGSCEGTCDHVWGYQYALPFLFPRLARNILETDYTYNIKDSGEMMFRTMVPLGSKKWDFRACVDGQMGCIIRFYREWKISGDDAFLKKYWDKIKLSLEYAWREDNHDMWDPNQDGVIKGRQHHTLDVELFSANSWLTGYYLAALKAASEMAEYLGDKEKSDLYLKIFNKGQQYVEKNLFNGEHYIQEIDVKDKSILQQYEKYDENILSSYWNSENQEIKYQLGDACEIDQLVAQWHAALVGLGDIFDKENRKIAAKTIYEINFKSMREVFNPCRIFAVNDEKGLVICNWKERNHKPQIPIPYAEECMTGFEYAAAGLMIQEGFVDEGIKCINAVRERYDGKKRNPYAEIECGSNYARSMASFAFLLIFSGFKYNMTKNEIGFSPIINKTSFKSFWSIDGVWGTVEINEGLVDLKVLYGTLDLKSFLLPDNIKIHKVQADKSSLIFTQNRNEIKFENVCRIYSQLRFEA